MSSNIHFSDCEPAILYPAYLESKNKNKPYETVLEIFLPNRNATCYFVKEGSFVYPNATPSTKPENVQILNGLPHVSATYNINIKSPLAEKIQRLAKAEPKEDTLFEEMEPFISQFLTSEKVIEVSKKLGLS